MKKTFAEVVLLARTGLNPRKNFKLGQGNNNYITIKNIKNNTLVIDENTDVVDDEAIKLIHKRSKIKKGDILFASIGRMGDMYIIEDDPVGWDINESVFVFTLDTNIVRQKYFYYIFRVKSTLDYLASNSSGSTFKSIKMNQLKKMTFDIPPLEKQDQIVATLDKVCNVIEMRKQELISLDDLIKARFVELFGDAVDNPMGWKKKSLQEIVTDDCTISYGIVQTGDNQEEGVPVFRPVDIVNRVPRLDELKKTTEEISNKYKRTILKGREMLITVRANIADTCIVGEEFKGCNVGRGIVPIRIQEDIMTLEFLKYLIDSKHLNDEIKNKAKGITLLQLNMEDLREIKLIIPPLNQQNVFVKFVKQVDKSKVAVQKALDETQLLFNSLMQEYFG